MPGPADRFLSVRGINLHYLDWGGGSSKHMILLHGLSGCAHFWDFFASALKNQYHILALDQRGHGDSEWAKEAAYTPDEFVADLAEFADALKLGSFILAGHSIGGQVGIAYAASHSSRVSSLIIIDVGPELDPRGVSRRIQEMKAAPQEFDSLQGAIAEMRKKRPHTSSEVLRHQVSFLTKALPNGKIAWKRDRALEEVVLTGKHWPLHDFWALLSRLSCPTLIVRGSESDVLPRQVAKRMEEVIPQARSVEIERAGHRAFLDNPTQFEAVVRDFLQMAPSQQI